MNLALRVWCAEISVLPCQFFYLFFIQAPVKYECPFYELVLESQSYERDKVLHCTALLCEGSVLFVAQ